MVVLLWVVYLLTAPNEKETRARLLTPVAGKVSIQ